jgi:hypothetical protein
MSKILKRPMFRIGGSVNEGIVSMAEPRKNYQSGSDYATRIEELRPILQQAAGPGRSERDRALDLLLRGSIRLASERPVGNIFSTAAKAFQEPVDQYLKAGEAEDAFQRQINLAAATQGISSVEAERLQRMKLADELQKINLAKEELFYKSPIGVALGASAKTVYDTLKIYDQEKIPYYAKPFNINMNTKKLDTTGLDAVPVGVRFFDTNGKFYERTEKGYREVYGKSGQDVVPITVEKKPGFFESVKEKGAAYDPRSWNKQKFYDSLVNKNKTSNME